MPLSSAGHLRLAAAAERLWCPPTAAPRRFRTSLASRAAGMSSNASSCLVTPAWLKERLHDQGVRVLDASWYMPNAGRNATQEFCKERIPGSGFFDLDKISDRTSNLPHMLPAPKAFAAAMDALGVRNDTSVVLYDRAGIFSAPRAWWTFRVFGHDQVAVLDGGYKAWLDAGGEVDAQACSSDEADAAAAATSPPEATQFRAQLRANMVRDVTQMQANVDRSSEAVVDARDAGRFAGTAPEPRPGIRGGHIPGSLNVPFGKLLEDGRFRSAEEIDQVFRDAGVTPGQPVVASCGTGVTAAILALGLHIVDPGQQVAVYDGSWTEWGGREDTPVEVAQRE